MMHNPNTSRDPATLREIGARCRLMGMSLSQAIQCARGANHTAWTRNDAANVQYGWKAAGREDY